MHMLLYDVAKSLWLLLVRLLWLLLLLFCSFSCLQDILGYSMTHYASCLIMPVQPAAHPITMPANTSNLRLTKSAE
jgi:hypothetical protein